MNAKQLILAIVAVVFASSAFASQPSASDLVTADGGTKAAIAALKP